MACTLPARGGTRIGRRCGRQAQADGARRLARRPVATIVRAKSRQAPWLAPSRRGGRVAEGARLESVFTGNRNGGSNPPPSAISFWIFYHFLEWEGSNPRPHSRLGWLTRATYAATFTPAAHAAINPRIPLMAGQNLGAMSEGTSTWPSDRLEATSPKLLALEHAVSDHVHLIIEFLSEFDQASGVRRAVRPLFDERAGTDGQSVGPTLHH